MSIQEIQTMEDQGTGGCPGQTETSAADAAAVPVLPLRFERQGIYWRLDRLSCGRFLAHVLRYLSVYGDKPPDWNGNLLYAEIAEDDLLLLGALFENMQLEERVLQLLPARPFKHQLIPKPS